MAGMVNKHGFHVAVVPSMNTEFWFVVGSNLFDRLFGIVIASRPYQARNRTRPLNKVPVTASVAWQSTKSGVMDCHVASLLAMTGVFMESAARQSRAPEFMDCHVADAPRNDGIRSMDCHVADAPRNDGQVMDCRVTSFLAMTVACAMTAIWYRHCERSAAIHASMHP